MALQNRRIFLDGILAAGLVLALTAGSHTTALPTQDAPDPDLDWGAWISEFAVVDLSGNWVFDANDSDPMVELWAGRRIVYRIDHQPTHVRLEFRPENGRPNIQTYRWNGRISSFERQEAEVRERARWTRGGRVLEVEGRWWLADDRSEVHQYFLTYELGRGGTLVFTQRNADGATVWRFRRERETP